MSFTHYALAPKKLYRAYPRKHMHKNMYKNHLIKDMNYTLLMLFQGKTLFHLRKEGER